MATEKLFVKVKTIYRVNGSSFVDDDLEDLVEWCMN